MADLLGLYLQLKQQRQQEEQHRNALEARRQAQAFQGFQQALDFAKLGDEKLALRYLSMATDDQDTMEMRELVSGISKQSKKQAAAKAATPTPGAQTDMARGVASQLQQPGDPLQNALAGLRGIPEGVPGELATQIAQRGGAIAGEQQRSQGTFEERLIQRTQAQLAGAQAKQAMRSQDAIFPVKDKSTGETSTIVGLDNLRSALGENPNLLVTGKPTAVGTDEEVFGKPTRSKMAQLQDQQAFLQGARDDINEALSLIKQNPALAGFAGSTSRIAGGAWQTLKEMSGMPVAETANELVESTLDRIVQDGQDGLVDSRAAAQWTKALTDPSAPALDVLGAAITYGYAMALRGEGKLTVDDKKRAEDAVGIRTGLTTSSKQVEIRLQTALKRVERQLGTLDKRINFNQPKSPPRSGGGMLVDEGEATMTPLDAEPAGGFDIDLMGAR